MQKISTKSQPSDAYSCDAYKKKRVAKEAPLEEFINQYIAGNDKVRREIDAILPRLKLEKKSTICEIEMILNRVEKINKAVHSFFGQLSHEQADVDSVLNDMFRNREIDNKLKHDFVKAISDLHVGDGLFLQRGS